MLIHATENDFEKIESSKDLVVVDFWASWCGPCKMLGPIFEELASEMEDVTFAKVNVDENPTIASKYRVGSIPTIIALKNGQVVDTSVGFKPKADLKAFVERNK